jgi:hypothetical protein
MTIDTPLHAEPQLDQLAGQFAHWRQTRPHPSTRIPPALWEQAVALARALPPARVAKQLGLRVIDLTRQMERQQAPPAPVVPRPLSFVEVPALAPPSLPPLTTHLELSRADGTRLCIQAPVAALPLAALVQAFVEGRACSN